MATIMEMPKLSDTMTEGSIAKWLKKEGDKVTSGSPIIEIETDKATMEYEAPAGGVLLKILVGDGQKCPLQSPIAVIGKADEKWEEALEKYNAKKGGGALSPRGLTAGSSGTRVDSAVEPRNDNASPRNDNASPRNDNASPRNDVAIKASPLAKKIAEDKGIDLKSVQGSGPNGRIIQRDLENVRTQQAPISFASQAAVAGPEVEKIPLTNMRKTIARRLIESVNTAPHFFLTVSIDMTALLKWRKEAILKLSEDKKFSVNDIVIFLTARALKHHPIVNASWQDEFIAQYRDVHMSVAVALPNGLMTPVIRNADKLNIIQIAQESKRLVKLAKDGKLVPNDYTGGTFSISNLGMSGIEEFTAIINPPQAAILAVGSTVPTPVVSNEGNIVVENRMKVTLSCDHRVIDGLQGAEFLKTLKQYFEYPFSSLFFG
jgi:pyruvate dehydrogenase E2 component (dihydrolipoamide acetyltransferase)